MAKAFGEISRGSNHSPGQDDREHVRRPFGPATRGTFESRHDSGMDFLQVSFPRLISQRYEGELRARRCSDPPSRADFAGNAGEVICRDAPAPRHRALATAPTRRNSGSPDQRSWNARSYGRGPWTCQNATSAETRHRRETVCSGRADSLSESTPRVCNNG